MQPAPNRPRQSGPQSNPTTGNRAADINLGHQPPPTPPALPQSARQHQPQGSGGTGLSKPTGGHTPQGTATPPHLGLSADPSMAPHNATAPSPRHPAQAGRRASVAYLGAWGVVGLVAASYLVIIATKPDMFAGILPINYEQPSEPESNEGARARAKAVAEARSLKESLANAQIEISKLKADVEKKNAEREREALETPMRVPTTAASAPGIQLTESKPELAPAPAAPQRTTTSAEPAIPRIINSADQRAKNKAASDAITADATLPKPPSLDPAGDLAKATSALETSSIDKPKAETTKVDVPMPERRGAVPPEVIAAIEATKQTESAAKKVAAEKATKANAEIDVAVDSGFATTTSTVRAGTTTAAAGTPTGAATTTSPSTVVADFGEPIVTRAPRSVGVLLARGPSVDALRLSWSLLSENHAEALRNLKPRYIAGAGNGGPYYNLIAGPLPDDGSADVVCAKMRDRGIPCRTGTFMGNAL